MKIQSMTSLSGLTLEQLFPDTLTDTNCVYIDKSREVWVATEMCAQYIESNVDAIAVRGEDNKPIGIVGGFDILDCIRKNPTRDFQYERKVDEIMFRGVPQVGLTTTLKDLLETWKESRRAFALIPNGSGDYSPISARKMLEIGIRCKTDISISSLPKKETITFHHDDSLGDVVESMFANNARKVLLENSNQFISDRMILGEISRILNFQKDVDNLLDVPVKQIKLEHVRELKEDLRLEQFCSIMDKMDHPFVVYKGNIITPWDVCVTLLSEELSTTALGERYRKTRTCPHCGKEID